MTEHVLLSGNATPTTRIQDEEDQQETSPENRKSLQNDGSSGIYTSRCMLEITSLNLIWGRFHKTHCNLRLIVTLTM